MLVTLPLEVCEALEKGLGKEDARKVVKALEAAISDATDYKWKVTKDELLEEMRKVYITRDLFEERMKALEEKILASRGELEGRFENVRVDWKEGSRTFG